MLTDLTTIINYFRGKEMVTLKAALLAAISLLKLGVDQMADAATSLSVGVPAGALGVSDPESMIVSFEKLVEDHKHDHGKQAVISLPWATILPILLNLFKTWMAGRGAPATP